MKEKKRSPLDVVKQLARDKHAAIYTIVQGNLEGSSDTSEYAVVTEEGLFFYKLYEGSLTSLTQVEWQDVQSGTVDFYAMKTVLTLNHHTFRLQDQGKNIHQYAQKRTGIDIPVAERTWKQKIIGYRSSTPWKQTVAFFGYLFLAAFLLALLSPLTVLGVTSFIAVVIFVVALIALIKGKFEIFHIPNRKMAASLLVASFILIGVLPTTGEENEEPVALEAEEEAEAEEEPEQQEQEAAVKEQKKENPPEDEGKEKNQEKEQKEEQKAVSDEKEKAKEEEKAETQATKEADKEKAQAQASEEKAKEEEEKKESTSNATVSRVIDGDTLEVTMNGETKDIRLLLVDTPETKHPQKPVEPFGPEATSFVENKLLGEEVRVQVGSEETDKYGRTLAYVFLGEETIQEMLLEEGLAATAYLYNDLMMLDDFHAAQQIAIDEGIGVWSIPGYAQVDQENGFQYEEEEKTESEPEPEPTSEPEPTPTEETVETPAAETDVYYKNCDAVRAAGAAPVQTGDPGYAKHLDRDGDGTGCE